MITFNINNLKNNKIWEKFWYSILPTLDGTNTWQTEIEKYNGFDIPLTTTVGFETEEDMVVFILKFS